MLPKTAPLDTAIRRSGDLNAVVEALLAPGQVCSVVMPHITVYISYPVKDIQRRGHDGGDISINIGRRLTARIAVLARRLLIIAEVAWCCRRQIGAGDFA